MSEETTRLTITVGQVVVAAIVTAFGTVMLGAISFFGGRGSVQAQIQTALNLSFKELTDAQEAQRVADQRSMAEMRGEIAGLKQHIFSLERILRDNGIEVPRQPLTSVVFVQAPEGKPNA